MTLRRPAALFSLLSLGVFFSVLASPTSAQTSVSGSSRVFELMGTVTDGQTGQPVARALVATVDRSLAALTDRQGHFDIAVGLATVPGEQTGVGFALAASKPGYFARSAPTQVQLNSGGDASQTLQMVLMPGASLSGSVTRPTAGAADELRVVLLRHQVQNGLRHWLIADTAPVREDGLFKFGSLEPDEYTVLATTVQGGPGLGIDALLATSGLRPTFAGDAAEIGTATHFWLRYGDNVTAQIHLLPTTLVPVAIPVATTPGTLGVQATMLAPFLPEAATLAYDDHKAMVRGLLPPGSYQVLLTGYGGTSQTFALVSLQVGNAPVVTGAVSLMPPASVLVRVHPEFQHAESGSGGFVTAVTLTPEMPGTFQHGSSGQNGQDFTIGNVTPGHYSVSAFTSQGYVADLEAGGASLLQAGLVIPPGGGSAPIDITLRDDVGSLHGTVAHGSAPLPAGCVVALVAVNGSIEPRTTRLDGEDTFAVSSLPPGNYLLFALPQALPAEPYRDPAWVEQLRTKAVAVVVTAREDAAVTAPLLTLPDVEVQP